MRRSSVVLFSLLSTAINRGNVRMAQKCYAAERNKQVILDVLDPRIEAVRSTVSDRPLRILEIASGTGEHAALFAESILNIVYQPTEPETNMHESILSWTSSITHGVVNPPLALDLMDSKYNGLLPDSFRSGQTDVMICINMIHISPISCTDRLFGLASKTLQPGGFLLTYGPYRVNNFMVESNVAFDRNLKSRNPEWGVKDLEEVRHIAQTHGMDMVETVDMPANNLCVVFKFAEQR